ncbi:hypothetical protein ACFJIX_17985 [Roseateles sp. UC29_93]|uniref:head-tail joining protein n=1 Tax=Roseateles sp. UC29_93 TaxID=3350177 RepID=UPI0036703B49
MLPDFIAQDLAVAYAGPGAVDCALSAAAGGAAQPARGFFDAPGSIVDGLILSDPALRVSASTWPAARDGDSVMVGAVAYKVRAVVPLDDGAEKRLELARA